LEQSDSPATVVVGAGHGGGTLAAQLRQQGYRGQIILVGAEPHLPYHRPPLSKKFLSGQYEQWLRPDDFYTSQDIDVRVNTTVSAIDRPARRIITASGVEIGYEHLVLATGATARKLDVPGGSLERILTLRNLDDAAQLRRIVPTAGNVVIVGGGYVGLEVAAEISARSAAKVTVLEREDTSAWRSPRKFQPVARRR
ncbi:FAD-dependent oxidoreductase, partial [Mycolicibacterium sphagni]|uniref:FAD-dependent oxidoreductase n=1 Tax=Mycolicibacterium sphagni TaxID=1786 RepID=UPI0021F304D3